MSEKEISAISRVDMDGQNRLAQIAAQKNEKNASRSVVKKAEAVAQAQPAIAILQESDEQLIEKVSAVINQELSPLTTSLKFQINDETNDITVLIVDRATDKVLHTIPADAIKNLPAGKLLQYFA